MWGFVRKHEAAILDKRPEVLETGFQRFSQIYVEKCKDCTLMKV
jgi:hypothetical protein